MGRARIPMRRIENPKARNVTFKKRHEGLVKKLNEFATLCDVDVCMISCGPQELLGRDGCQTWPTEKSEVRRMIKRFMDLPEYERKPRMVDLAKFQFPRNEEEEKKKMKAPATSFPTQDPCLNHLSEAELRKLLFTLDSKLALVNERIELLESKKRLDFREEGRIMEPWNWNHFPNWYNSKTTDATDVADVKLPPLPPSCFDLPNLLPSTDPMDFGSYVTIDGGLAAGDMLESEELKPKKNLDDFQYIQQLLYDPSCLNPHGSEIVDMALGIHQEPIATLLPDLFHAPNFGAFEVNGFTSNIRKETRISAVLSPAIIKWISLLPQREKLKSNLSKLKEEIVGAIWKKKNRTGLFSL
ncbi:hypothetical protein ACLOJK_010560 [Asimina triloba]